MRLYINTMDSVLIDFDGAGRVRFENDDAWIAPSVQERRAIIHAAREELESLKELLDMLENAS
jgi:hypothetical protein